VNSHGPYLEFEWVEKEPLSRSGILSRGNSKRMQLCWSEINKRSTMILEDKYSNSLHDSKHDYIIFINLFVL
jgi:hypothetical protein